MRAYTEVQHDQPAKHVAETDGELAAGSPVRGGTVRRLGGRLLWHLGDARRKSFLRLHLVNAICRLLPESSLATLRGALYRRVGFTLGARVAFGSAATFIGSGPEMYGRLTIGDGAIFSLHPTFYLDDTITIGRNVAVSPGVVICTTSHRIGPASQRWTPNVVTQPVVIGDGVWIGLHSLILPGVVIGRGSVISAGSVVRTSVPPNSLVGGNPAQVIKELPTFED